MKTYISILAFLITAFVSAQTQVIPGKLKVKTTDQVITADSLVVRDAVGLFQHIKFTDLKTQLNIPAVSIFEKELINAENNINVGFNLLATTVVYFNGKAIPNALWSGEGTQILNLSLDTKIYDNLTVKN